MPLSANLIFTIAVKRNHLQALERVSVKLTADTRFDNQRHVHLHIWVEARNSPDGEMGKREN
jgi:hypothetical protein